MKLLLRLPVLALISHGAVGASGSFLSGRLRLRSPDWPAEDSGGAGLAATAQALQKVAAIEDARVSHTLCRIVATESQSSVTVRLGHDNSRQLVFNDDMEGIETKVKCLGAVDPGCAAGSPVTTARSVAECPKCPCTGTDGQLFGPYSVVMAQEVDRRCKASSSSGQPSRVLLLGLGAGELAAHVMGRCPLNSLEMDAVELDGRLPELAHLYFGLSERVHVMVGDAFLVVQQMRHQVEENPLLADSRRYDVVLVDCFAAGGVTPEHCRSAEFVGALHVLLRGGGKVMHHLWHEDPNHEEVARDFQATLELYKKECSSGTCSLEVRPLDSKVDNLIVVEVGADDSGV